MFPRLRAFANTTHSDAGYHIKPIPSLKNCYSGPLICPCRFGPGQAEIEIDGTPTLDPRFHRGGEAILKAGS